jgi:hypothetical protein
MNKIIVISFLYFDQTLMDNYKLVMISVFFFLTKHDKNVVIFIF